MFLDLFCYLLNLLNLVILIRIRHLPFFMSQANLNDYTLPNGLGLVKLDDSEMNAVEQITEHFLNALEENGDFNISLVIASELQNKLEEFGKQAGHITKCSICKQETTQGDLGGTYCSDECFLIANSGITPGGKCRCGESLPAVADNCTPYEFCSAKCKQEAKEATQ